MQGSVQKKQPYEALSSCKRFTAAVPGQYTVPIYQGGAEYSPIRQAKETHGQRRLIQIARDQAAGVAKSRPQLEAAKAKIESTRTGEGRSRPLSTAYAKRPALASAPP